MAVDTSKPGFLITNYAADATITATEEATSHDADNLKVATYSTTYRSTGVTADRIVTFDLGATKTDLEAFALWGSNLTDAATREWETASDAAFTSLIHNPGASAAFDVSRVPYVDDTPPWGRATIYVVTAGTSGRYARVRLTDTANPDGYLEAAHAYIGPVTQPAGMDLTWTPGTEIVGGPGRSIALTTHRLVINAATEDARRGMQSLERALMATGRFGFIPRLSDDANWLGEAILCQLAAPVDYFQFYTAQGILWNMTLTLREIRG